MRIQGTFNDATPLNQPQGLASFLLNTNNKINVGSQTSDYGHELIRDLAGSFGTGKILGSIVVSNDIQVLFYKSIHGHVLLKTKDNVIQILDDGSFDVDLSFDETTSVHGVFKYNSQRELIIYFVYNGFFRWLNCDNPLNTNDANQLNVFQGFKSLANLADTSEVIQFGGSLLSGMYYVCFTYLDETLNEDNYFYVSNPFPIIEDNTNLNYSVIQGSAPDVPTNKCIRLDIQNVDTDKKYLRVVVIPYINGVLKTGRIVKDIPINNSSLTFTYTGSESYTEISLDSILIDKAKYETVETIQSVDNTHYIAGLTKSKDLNLQPYVNNIKLSVCVAEYDFEGSTSVNTYKGKLNVFNKTFKQGEVYAFYLVGTLKKDGSKTFAYHIPARKPLSYFGSPVTEATIDLQTMAGTGSYPDADELAVKYGNAFKGYKLLETAAVTTSTKFGYWENENETYPNTDDFKVKDNTGVQIDDFRNQKVRHHKFPINSNNAYSFVSKSGTATKQRVLGVTLPALDTIFPQEILDQLACVELFYAKRNGNNNLWQGSSIYVFSSTVAYDNGNTTGSEAYYTVGENRVRLDVSNNFRNNLAGNQTVRLYPVDSLVNNSDVAFDFVKIPLWYYVKGLNCTGPACWNINSPLEPIGSTFSNLAASGMLFEGSEFYVKTSSTLSSSTSEGLNGSTIGVKTLSPLIPANSRITFNDSLYNTLSYIENMDSQSFIQAVLENPITRGNRFNSGGNNGFIVDENFYDVTSKQYRYDVLQNTSFNFDGYGVGLMEMFSLRSDCYLNWNTQELVSTGVVITDFTSSKNIYGGDVFNNYTFFRVTSKIRTSPTAEYYNIVGYYYPTQSACNIGLRYITAGGQSRFYPINNILQALGQTGFQQAEIFSYNKDYTKLNDLKPPISKPDNFVENSNFETTIAKSQVDNNESLIDNNRIYLSNNYLVLPYRGKIKNLGKFQNILIPHFEQAILKTLGREQLDIQGNVVQLGKGDLFAIPPKEVLLTAAGYGGIEYRQSACSTPYGYFYVDTVGKKVFILADGLEEVSEYGYRNFFNERLDFTLYKSLSEFNVTEKELLRISVENEGVGVSCFYDGLYKRVFLTVHDYEPITTSGSYLNTPLTESTPALDDDVLVFYQDRFYKTTSGLGTTVGNNTILPVRYTDINFFINKSFTMSYNLLDKKWNGFHSFLPTHGYDVQDGYRVVDNSKLYLGNVPNTGYFDSESMEVIVEVIFNGEEYESKKAQVINITCEQKNSNGVRIIPELTSYSLYNSFQASGEISANRINQFNPYQGNYWYSVKNLFINKFRDYITDRFANFFSSELYPTLKDYNNSVISQSIPPFKAGKFVDKWVAVRFKVVVTNESFVINDVSLIENFEKLS